MSIFRANAIATPSKERRGLAALLRSEIVAEIAEVEPGVEGVVVEEAELTTRSLRQG